MLFMKNAIMAFVSSALNARMPESKPMMCISVLDIKGGAGMSDEAIVQGFSRCEAECSKCRIREQSKCGWQKEEQEARIRRGLKQDEAGLWHYVPTPVGFALTTNNH